MSGRPQHFHMFGTIVHKYFLVLLLAAYTAAVFWPSLGILAKEINLARLAALHEAISFPLPMLLLASLLFSAGLAANTAELSQVLRRPHVVFLALALNLLVPFIFLVGAYPALRFWHNPDEVQNLLLGLAVVAAMPVAGSSTAWSQNANGNMALSLGLVVFSTIFCPVTTPLTLLAFASAATGPYADALSHLSGQQTGTFLLVYVVIPSFAGLLVRHWLGNECTSRIKPKLKSANALVLLFLCYVNAATALPQIIAAQDWDYLAIVLLVVGGLCLSAFAAGWLLARLLQLSFAQQKSLMFGLGMNNNGTGMALASIGLSSMPCAFLPVLTYNLVQHLVAGSVNRIFSRRDG